MHKQRFIGIAGMTWENGNDMAELVSAVPVPFDRNAL
jgi:hypothetical protein